MCIAWALGRLPKRQYLAQDKEFRTAKLGSYLRNKETFLDAAMPASNPTGPPAACPVAEHIRFVAGRRIRGAQRVIK
jgi:hypothetical protein